MSFTITLSLGTVILLAMFQIIFALICFAIGLWSSEGRR